jgi:hypothetical protein
MLIHMPDPSGKIIPHILCGDAERLHGRRRYDPREGGGRISSGMKSRATQEAKAEIVLPDYRDVGDEFFPDR